MHGETVKFEICRTDTSVLLISNVAMNIQSCPLVLLTLVLDKSFMKEVEKCSMHYALHSSVVSSCNSRPIVLFVLSTNSFPLLFGGTE